MERTHIISRDGKVLRRIHGVEFYTFDEVFYTEGRRSVRFYDEDRELVEEVDLQAGDWVTPKEIGFHAHFLPRIDMTKRDGLHFSILLRAGTFLDSDCRNNTQRVFCD